MEIEIKIFNDDGDELLKGNYLTFGIAEEGLAKLQRAYEEGQSRADDMLEEASKGEEF